MSKVAFTGLGVTGGKGSSALNAVISTSKAESSAGSRKPTRFFKQAVPL